VDYKLMIIRFVTYEGSEFKGAVSRLIEENPNIISRLYTIPRLERVYCTRWSAL
jgi:hypothetical protein